MKRFALVHPFLFAIISVVFSYWRTSLTISFLEIFRPLLFLLFFLTLLIYPVHRLTKDWDWTGISLSIFVLGFYYKRDVFLIVVFSVILFMVFWFLYSKIRRKKVEFKEITFLLNMISIILLIVGGVKTATLLAQVPFSYYQKTMLSNERSLIAEPIAKEVNPDIYYIVLDGYARADVLEDLYGFDNSAFINDLQLKGFIIPTDNLSNYPKTSLSISSTLNMDYIQSIAPELENSYFWWLMTPLINYSQTRVMLEEIGYETVSISSSWTITNNKTTDIYYQPSLIQLSEFDSHLLLNTPLALTYSLVDKMAYIPLSIHGHREMVLFNFETLSQIPQLAGEKFVFAHIIAPHPPFTLDKDGNHINSAKPFTLNDADAFRNEGEDLGSPEDQIKVYREEYIGQVEYINTRIIEIVDDILKNSDTPPIIIFQADHGSGMFTDFSSAEETCMHERFSPFAAYYLPDLDESLIPSDITPVNLFRIIFNEYFETKLPLLENYYYFSDPLLVYKMEEVSLQRINIPCKTQP